MRAALGAEVTCVIPLPAGPPANLGARIDAVDALTGARTVVVPFVAATVERRHLADVYRALATLTSQRRRLGAPPPDPTVLSPVAVVTLPGPAESGDYLLTWVGASFEAPVPLVVEAAGPLSWP